jgi:hypothetical protein
VNIGDPVDVCIPTGNFGNILAAFYTKVRIKAHSCISFIYIYIYINKNVISRYKLIHYISKL